MPTDNHSIAYSLNRPTRVILVRHGRSTFNEQGRYQGSSDESVLTETGQETARQVGVLLKGLSIDAIYASPLRRVEQTVNAILSVMEQDDSSTPTYKTWLLREIDLLAWEGLRFQVVQEQFAEAYRCWKQRPHEFQMPAAALHSETPSIAPTPPFFPVLDLYDRAQQFWHTILPQHKGEALLVVGHGGTNHALISTALGLSAAQHHTLQQSNCSVSVLEFPDNTLKQATLRSLNLTHHLGETLPKLKEGKQGLRLLLVPAVADVKQTQSLTERLKTTPIHFCLNDHSHYTCKMTGALLCHHPATVQFQTLHQNFADLWQQTLINRRTQSPDLITGLMIADTDAIQRLLAQAIELNAKRGHLSIQPGTVSVLHYPSIDQHPILQALNLGGVVLPGDRVKFHSSLVVR